MQFFPVKIPKFLKRLFPNYVWEFSSKDKVIYLTFDDGPTPEITNWTLKTLNNYNAKATFFCIGNNVAKHPDIFKNIINEGHSVGNHTHDHLAGWKTNTEQYIKNTQKAHKIITSHLDSNQIKLNIFRPPFGKIKNSQAKRLKQLGYKIIMWTVISYDWEQKINKGKCLNSVIKNTKNGSIIVFHDSIKAKKNMQYALPKFLDHFTKKGYQFKAIKA